MEILPCSGDLTAFGPLAMQQHPSYLHTVRRMGHMAQAHMIRTQGQVIGRAQVVYRRFGPISVNWIARGPIWTQDTENAQKSDALAALIRHLPAATFTLATPDRADTLAFGRRQRFHPVMTPQYVAELDLTAPEPSRLAAQHGKWRNRLRHAQGQGTTISDTPFRTDRDSHLLAIEATQRKQRRYHALPLPFVQHWAAANPKGIRIFRALGCDGLHAFMLVLLHHPGATYHIGWSNAAGRTASSHNLLMWHASNWLADRGYTRFDLGVVDTEHSPGLARFKISTGAQIGPLGPTLLRLERPRLTWRKSRVA
ncbi:GNAT family N-acetyltransferase [Roseovarius sp. 2305UL8-3]|uniref:GNAT family N-acetyltransferase n=1 Tax=Roseovarius conchicola TaxID=3121636 RepID=UPI00352878BD